ncbi:MAG TPA: hypothetical protein VFT45_06495 [Longimicrobium sp.]|nr:hypothetical protein [Longimicrobium sp.]
MKLNPEEIVVVSFETQPDLYTSSQITVDPNDPTPASRCFVCD